MDVVASRAGTSKRSLYAHFESKEKLFLAVVELVRGLFLSRLGMPGDGDEPPAEALVTFCARYLQTLLYQASIQMMRVSMAESARFPEGAAAYFDVMFAEVHARLEAYLREMFALPPAEADRLAQHLLSRILHPRLPRALLGLDTLATSLDPDAQSSARNAPAPNSPDDLRPIRDAVAEVMGALQGHPRQRPA